MKKTILITGGLGYIGSHTVVLFEQFGYKTVIIDNLSNSSLSILDDISSILGYKPDFHLVDLCKKEELNNVFKKYKFEGVIHFAGLKAVGESCEKPGLYFENNVQGGINLFNCMLEHKVLSIVFSSSCTVYGDPKYVPVDEKHPFGETTNPYGKTKQLLEYILKDYSKFSGFKVVSLRYFNPIGSHSSGFLGEKTTNKPANLFPYIFKVLNGELPNVQIFGNDFETDDGTGVRDYIDINDLVSGHLSAWNYLIKQNQSIYQPINLGVGKGISVLEMISKIEEVSGKKIPYIISERRSGDIGLIYANNSLAKQLLSEWTINNTIETSIKNTIGFQNKQNNF